jgi:hypothetical protein
MPRPAWLAALAAALPAPAPAADPPAGFRDHVAPFLAKHCAACHSGDKKAGKFTLDGLDPDPARGKDADAWKRVAERVDSGEMPPDDKPRPAPAELRAAVGWLAGELRKGGKEATGLGSGPTGNHLDHDLIFSGKADAPLDNPPRLWRFSPEIYSAWVLRQGHKNSQGQAMTPAAGDGFTDRAGNLTIDEGTFAVVLRNAQRVAENATRHTIQDGKVVPERGVSAQVAALLDPNGSPTRAQVEAAVNSFAFYRRWGRFGPDEMNRLMALYDKAVAAGGRAAGLRAVLVAIQLQPEALFRLEIGLGPPDEKGRRLLGPRELAYALSFAVGYELDRRLADDANAGKLKTREDAAREAKALLARPAKQNPRLLQFFQEYFAYTSAPDVFKEGNPNHNGAALVRDTDELVLHVLAADKDVLKELLTTNTSFVGVTVPEGTRKSDASFKRGALYKSYGLDAWPEKQPVELPAGERAGVLTQPSWLVAMSGNFDNHPVQRGRWVRERLLGGVVPPVPVSVNAQVPDDPTRTIRDRLTGVTKEAFCWQCHKRMNALGLPFEQFDHFGRFRTTDPVVDPTKPATPGKKKTDPPVAVLKHPPVDTTGLVEWSGDAALDGPVENPVALVKRLAASPRVRQVFVRHAFRFWMGRDENLGDAPTLIAADKAYVESGGSMKALVLSLLTSDSFLVRTPPPQ